MTVKPSVIALENVAGILVVTAVVKTEFVIISVR